MVRRSWLVGVFAVLAFAQTLAYYVYLRDDPGNYNGAGAQGDQVAYIELAQQVLHGTWQGAVHYMPGLPAVNAFEKRQPPVKPADPAPHLLETEAGWLKKMRSDPVLNSDIGEQPAAAFPGGLDWLLAPTIGGLAGESGVFVPAFGLLNGEEYKNAAFELFAAQPRMVPPGVTVVPDTLLKYASENAGLWTT